MITIITGEVNSGKTKLLKEMQKEQGGAGFYSNKVFRKEILIGYDLVSFTSHRSIPLARFKPFTDENWKEKYTQGAYSFNSLAFDFAEKIIEEALAESRLPLFIDEIGYLELRNEGIAEILKKVIRLNVDISLTIRAICLDKILETYHIENYKIIAVTHKNLH